ncbi:hypothetical protein ACFV4X_26225 [Streptomyces ardesiacus]|uniref:hypothetical protein n=1 Tax=Streptomyces ardesiacus TaxID=285564 RepID=UPI00364ECA5B
MTEHLTGIAALAAASPETRDVASTVVLLLAVACFLALVASVVARHRIENHPEYASSTDTSDDHWTGGAS